MIELRPVKRSWRSAVSLFFYVNSMNLLDIKDDRELNFLLFSIFLTTCRMFIVDAVFFVGPHHSRFIFKSFSISLLSSFIRYLSVSILRLFSFCPASPFFLPSPFPFLSFFLPFLFPSFQCPLLGQGCRHEVFFFWGGTEKI